VAISGGASASFQYDPFGRRVSKTIGGMTQYLYDGANPIQEISGTTASANLLTGGVDEYFQRTDLAGARSFLTDALGSTLALSDSTGTLQTQYTFEPFGNTSTTGAATTNSFAYAGRELDATGLYFYRARYYSPTLQRFISEDPIGFSGGINLNRYAADNPISFSDPFGLDVTISLWPGAGGFGHVGVGVNTNDTQGFYPTTHKVCLLYGCDVPGDLLNDQARHPGVNPEIIIIRTTPEQDRAMQQLIDQRNANHGNYNLYGRNCSRFVEDVLRAGGLNPPDTTYPHDLFNFLRSIPYSPGFSQYPTQGYT